MIIRPIASSMKRITACLLVWALLLSVMPAYTLALAPDQTNPDPAQTEAITEPAPEAEPAAAAETEPEAEPAAEPADAPEAAPEAEPAAEAGQEAEPEAAAEEALSPAISRELKVDDLTVLIEAEAGAFPEGTDVTAEPADLEDVQDAVDEADDVDGKVLVAVDITFTDNGVELQPAQGKSVKVRFRAPMLEDVAEDAAVVHIDGETSKPEVVDTVETPADDEIAFEAEEFSVYAVIDGTGEEDARLKVTFVRYEAEDVVIYVKKSDTVNAERFAQVLYDPGAGEVSQSAAFYGWSEVEAYTAASTKYTIEKIRQKVKTMLEAGVQEGDEITYYAAVFKPFTVTYKNEKGVVLGSHTNLEQTSVGVTNYTVSMDYTVEDPDQQFVGWFISPVSNATLEDGTPVESDESYPNGTKLKLTGNLTMTVNTPSGRWLIFKENGQGVTYTRPQFLEETDSTVEPDDPTRDGYIFGGWYETADCTGEPFEFGSPLPEGEGSKLLYAKWTEKTSAKYTVLIWKQNVYGDDYDFYTAATFDDAAVGSTVAQEGRVSSTGTGENAYATVDGVAYSAASPNAQIRADFTGFHFDRFDPNLSTEISPRGDTVINVYYNRNTYTLTFRATDYTYSVYNGTSEGDYYIPNGNGGYTQVHLYRNNDRWYRDRDGGGCGGSYTYSNEYTGVVYTRSNNQTTQTVKTITALYQQNISDQFPIVGDNGVTYNQGQRWEPRNSQLYDDVIVYLETMPNENVTFEVNLANYTTKTMNYYVEALPGDSVDNTFGGKGYTLYNTVYANLNYLQQNLDCVPLLGYTYVGATPAFGANGQYSTNTLTGNFYYDRNKYVINFMDGVYLSGNSDAEVDNKSDQQLEQSQLISFGADISAYNSYVPQNAPYGYVFSGWYLDSACKNPCDFSTMPEGGLTVYAKWHNIQYRVFLHPFVPTTEPDDFMGGQATSFRVDHGESLEYIDAHREDYELVGWYMGYDETTKEYSNQFKFEAYELTDAVVTGEYDKSRSTELDLYGNVNENANSDANRPWINNCLELYARWREKIVGAEGINVEYDAREGTGAPIDDQLYKDVAKATVGSAAIPNSDDQVFSHWVVQRYENGAFVDTDQKVYPGSTFEVRKAYAKEEDLEGSTAENPKKKYTVMLRAAYVDKEQETLTHIYWYSNDGTDTVDKLNTLEDNTTKEQFTVNKAVMIKAPVTRSGYTFLGWARVREVEGDAGYVTGRDPLNPDTDPLGENDLFLKWDAESEKYLARNSADAWVEVTEVAADEDLPYHDMFAVWKADSFTVVCMTPDGTQISSNDYSIPAYMHSGFNLVASLPDGYYYGGYYAEAPASGAWSIASAYAGNENKGEVLKPQDGTTYYVKAVPTAYMNPYYKFTYIYSKKQVTGMWVMTALDDVNFAEAGFLVLTGEGTDDEALGRYSTSGSGSNKIGIRSYVWIENSDGSTNAKVYPKDVVGAAEDIPGYLPYLKVENFVDFASIGSPRTKVTFKVVPYWVTLDGVIVIGDQGAQITIHPNKKTTATKTNFTVTEEMKQTAINGAFGVSGS